MRRPKVIIVQAVCKHYRLPLFLSLQAKLHELGIDLRVVYSDPPPHHAVRHDNIELPRSLGTKVQGYWLMHSRVLLQLPFREIADADLVIIEHALKHLLIPILLLMSFVRGPKVAFWLHGGTLRSRVGGWKQRLRTFYLNSSCWLFAYTNGVAKLLATLGFNPKHITSLDNAIDVEGFQADLSKLSPADVQAVRSSLGIAEGAPVALFCGGLYKSRGVDFLLHAANLIHERLPAFHLILIGAGEAELVIPTDCNWIHPFGPIFGPSRAVYFRASDICLMPYQTGLGILDSMAAGLPYFVTGAHSSNPEIEYLVEGETGITTGDDPAVFAAKATELLLDKNRLAQMSRMSEAESHHYSIEKMASNFRDGIVSCLQTRTRFGSGSSKNW